MTKQLPRLTGGGFYDTRDHFTDQKCSRERNVYRYEIELFTADGGSAFIDGMEYKIHTGNVLISRPGDVRYSRLHFSCLFTHFETEDERMNALLNELPSFLQGDHTCAVEHLLARAGLALTEPSPIAMTLGQAAVMELICRLWELSGGGRAYQSDILPALRHIDMHFHENIRVHEMAARCNLSVSTFHAHFRQETGKSPAVYLGEVRIAAAKKRLLSTNESTEMVAWHCGFSSGAYFSYAFGKATGMSPVEYRKSHRYVI